MYDSTTVAAHLRGLLDHVVGSELPLDSPDVRAASLWNLGLTSADFMRLLADIETGFGIKWDLDDSAEAVSTFNSLLAHVRAHATRLPQAQHAGEPQ
ncbi:phosphopantetheine-binding protein [Streptomyces lasiicapitis]|uniref:phosphopantetheine-binding protein n=1 Tax=Streptomyces lasiicapitis TaxID=1923961 RepID=UPI0036C109A3